MQRLSSYTQMKTAAAFGNAPGRNQGARPDPRNPITGIYGAGEIEFITSSRTYTVKPGCTRIRVRGWSPGGTATVTGGTVSFGAYFSITGGAASNVSSAPGVATGGDINYTGGARVPGGGGGAAANLFGSGDIAGAGGAWGHNGRSGLTGKGGSTVDMNGEPGLSHVLDFIGTGGGGCGINAPNGGNGSNGGGGGGGSTATAFGGGKGGFPGGGDAGVNAGAGDPGADGGGFALKEISGLVPGATITVTVPAGGLIVVES